MTVFGQDQLTQISVAGRQRYLDMDLAVEIERLAGNCAIEQYLELRRKGLLNCQRKPESEPFSLETLSDAELKAELERRRKGAA